MSADTPAPPDDDGETPIAARPPRSRVLIGLVIGVGALLLAVVLVIVLVIPRGTPSPAGAASTPTASPTVRPTPTATRSATPTPTPTALADAAPDPETPVDPQPAPPVAAPAPAPAPANPPPLPPPPAPVIPPLSIDSMDAYPANGCGTSSWITVSWSTTGAITNSAEMRIKSGGGTPIFDQVWVNYPTTTTTQFNLDCTRPIWFFTLTVSNGTTTKTGRLTMANGVNQGWSSVAP